VRSVKSFSDIEEQFNDYIRDIVYATLTTVDRSGRPRSRILLPIWQVVDDRPVGWIAAHKTPVKTAHLSRNPHVTCSYWSPRQNAVFADGVARWEEDPDVRAEVWELYRRGSPPGVGYDPGRYWTSPTDPKYAALRIDPFRVQVLRGIDLGSRFWQPDEQN